MGRRPSDAPPPYRRDKPSGRALMVYQGKKYWLGKYGSPESKAKYARLCTELLASTTAVIALPPARRIIDEITDLYWAHCLEYYKPSVRTGDTATPESVVSTICPLPMNSATLWVPSGP